MRSNRRSSVGKLDKSPAANLHELKQAKVTQMCGRRTFKAALPFAGLLSIDLRLQAIAEEHSHEDTISLGCKPEKPTIGIECISAASFDKLETVFLASVDEALTHPTVYTKNEVQCVWPEASDLDDLGDPGDPGGVEAA
jgi:hypothetical protein